MSYIEDNLMSGETVVVRGKLHKALFLVPMAGACLGMLIFVVSILAIFSKPGAFGGFLILIGVLAGLALTLGGAFRAVGGFLALIGNEVAVTSRRVIGKFGVLRRETLEFPFSQIESIALDQGAIDRLVGGAQIKIRGSGSAWVQTPMLSNYKEFRSAALEKLENLRSPEDAGTGRLARVS